MDQETIGIIGVGLMGHGIASSLRRNGWRIGFLDHPGNQPTEDLVAGGAWTASTPAEVAEVADTILLCVTGSPQVEAIISGNQGILDGFSAGKTVIDCSTALPESTRRMATLVEEAGGRMLDAPMTRTPREAAEGRLNLIVGGDRSLFDAKLPVFQAFAENIIYAGPVGSGHTLKLLHNFVSLGFSAVLAEAAAASKQAGIEPKTFHRVLADGGGAGVVLERLAPYILGGDSSGFRFTMANSFKDLDYYCTMAAGKSSQNDIARAVRAIYEAQVKAGHENRFVPDLIDGLAGEA